MGDFNWKPVVLALYDSFLYAKLKAYVDSSDNEWDNTVLDQVDKFLRDFLK